MKYLSSVLFFVLSALMVGCSKDSDNVLPDPTPTPPPSSYFKISPQETVFSASSETKTFTFQIDANVSWECSTDADWVQLSTTASTGKGQLSVTVSANSSYTERTAQVKLTPREVKEVTLTFKQEAYLPESATLMDGESLNHALKSLADGKTLDGASSNQSIGGIHFETSYFEEPSSSAILVSTEESVAPVYAEYDSSKKLIILRTAAKKMVANEDMSHTFDYMSQLKELDLNALDFSEVKNMAGMFAFCGITTVDLSACDFSSAEDMSSLFLYATDLQHVEMPQQSTPLLETMAGMFSNCRNLVNVSFNGLTTGEVTDMSSMFDNCQSLKQLDLSTFDVQSVETMSAMFAYCSVLESLDLSNFTSYRLKDVSGMFERCEKLKNVDLSNFETSYVTDFTTMFSRCLALEALDLSSFDLSSAFSVERMLGSCLAIKELVLSAGFECDMADTLFGSRFAEESLKCKISCPEELSSWLIDSTDLPIDRVVWDLY